jgi:hypothetical protein
VDYSSGNLLVVCCSVSFPSVEEPGLAWPDRLPSAGISGLFPTQLTPPAHKMLLAGMVLRQDPLNQDLRQGNYIIFYKY